MISNSFDTTENDILSDNVNIVPHPAYLSNDFVCEKDTNHQDVSQVLNQIRTKYLHNLIIAHLNVNSLASKLDAIKTIIPGNIDIMIFSETKLDASYPTAQLMIDGYKTPFRLDRNSRGGWHNYLHKIRYTLLSKI